MKWLKTTTLNLYKANISPMCSNVEQIITVTGNAMDELNQSVKRHTVGPFVELDSLNGSVMKRHREALNWNRP